MEYLSTTDKKYTKRLIEAILKRGYHIAINNGEGLEIFANDKKFTKDTKDIHSMVGATGEDWIKIIHKPNADTKAKCVGTFYLIYHNGTGMEVICDYTSNDICNEIYVEIDDE